MGAGVETREVSRREMAAGEGTGRAGPTATNGEIENR
jgi:hypothetical protein